MIYVMIDIDIYEKCIMIKIIQLISYNNLSK